MKLSGLKLHTVHVFLSLIGQSLVFESAAFTVLLETWTQDKAKAK